MKHISAIAAVLTCALAAPLLGRAFWGSKKEPPKAAAPAADPDLCDHDKKPFNLDELCAAGVTAAQSEGRWVWFRCSVQNGVKTQGERIPPSQEVAVTGEAFDRACETRKAAQTGAAHLARCAELKGQYDAAKCQPNSVAGRCRALVAEAIKLGCPGQ